MIPLSISLVIPVRNEASSVEALLHSIRQQTLQPDEVIFVDGGSDDQTVSIIHRLTEDDERIRVIEAGDAFPGKGRNIGVANARCDWIAFTDAGITLEKDWLEHLAKVVTGDVDVVFGNYAPLVTRKFEKWATIAYVSPKNSIGLRGKTVVSLLLRKTAFQTVNGFPDFRAAEDLIFMEKLENAGFSVGLAPGAMAYWQLRPDLLSTFQKFSLYSEHNVMAGRQAYWHYGLLRQYLVALLFLLLAVFSSVYWILFFPVWFLARAAKRIYLHREEFGVSELFNPLTIAGVIIILVSIDLATFIGWIKAKFLRGAV
jgi:glycosyltransferase involved in cell wall biosynthesis